MGNENSGRWRSADTKTMVEECSPARHSGQLGRPPWRRCVTRQAAFLAAYRKTASIAAAAKAAGIKPAQHYRWLATSAAYWETFTDLQADVTGSLQDQLVELATGGRAKPVCHRGRVCGTFQRPSVRLLIFFLEAMRPAQYRRLRTEHNSVKSGPTLSRG